MVWHWIRNIFHETMFLFVCFVCLFVWVVFFGPTPITGEGLHILTYTRHSWPLSNILSHEWNKFHIKRQLIECSQCLLHFCLLLNTFLLIFEHYMQYMTWYHNRLLFFIFSHCENNSLWRYYLYSMDKTRYFTAEDVIKTNTRLNFLLFFSQKTKRHWSIFFSVGNLEQFYHLK
mgnify:CR=1 FL=1